MRVLVTGRYVDDVKTPLSKLAGVELVEDSPDLVLTHGGDGALLGAERDFPGVPKLPLRDARTAPLCPDHASFEKRVEAFLSGDLPETRLMKLGGFCGSGMLKGINDVFIHNVDRVGALRYVVLIDGAPYGHEIIGDGVGVSTVHGSTAYYRSITHSIFKIGIGLAFSNSTEVTNHLVLPEDSVVEVRLTRGPGVLVADNSPDGIQLKTGESARIEKIEEFALIYGLDEFMCPECGKLRHSKSGVSGFRSI
jgi:NAD+ kinase